MFSTRSSARTGSTARSVSSKTKTVIPANAGTQARDSETDVTPVIARVAAHVVSVPICQRRSGYSLSTIVTKQPRDEASITERTRLGNQPLAVPGAAAHDRSRHTRLDLAVNIQPLQAERIAQIAQCLSAGHEQCAGAFDGCQQPGKPAADVPAGGRARGAWRQAAR